MKDKTDKCHFITCTDVCNSSVESTSCEKLLRVKIESKLTFEDHVKDICKKANKTQKALA